MQVAGHAKAAPVAWTRAVEWDRLALVAMAVMGAIYGAAAVMGRAPIPGDAWVYWQNPPGVYGGAAYVYPPVLTQLLEPLRRFDAWQLYLVGWMCLCFASLGYVLGRWAFLAAFLIVPDIALGWSDQWWAGPIEAVLLGNVTLPMVAAIVLGARHPEWFAVPLLTKITPGVGVLWFAFRGEWRRFALALAVPGLVAGISFALAPDAWTAFVRFAIDNRGATSNGPPIVGPPLALRLAAAVLLTAWGARTNRPWVLPLAAAMSLIGLYGWATFASVACGAIALRRDNHGRILSTKFVPAGVGGVEREQDAGRVVV